MAGEIIPRTRAALEHDVGRRAVDGRDGTNRCRTRVNQLGVEHDVAAVFAWIADRAASPKTKRVFLAEARRLYWWLLERARKPLSSLTRDDLMSYRDFLQDPGRACMGRKVAFLLRDGAVNPAWRPFEGPLTDAHVEHVFAVLKSLFKYLVDMGYLDGNPLGGMRAQSKASMGDHRVRQVSPAERALDELQWSATLAAAEALPQTTPGQCDDYERARFLLRLFYHLGARIGELASHRMQHFQLRGSRWKWSVVGKGGKLKAVSVNRDLLESLKRYRVYLGLSPLPVAGEDLPLLLSKNGTRPISERQAFRIIKMVFAKAANKLESTHPEKAAALRNASPHWIRHATASHLACRATTIEELIAVQEHMRHDKLKTTLDYTHLPDEAAEAVAERLCENVKKRN